MLGGMAGALSGLGIMFGGEVETLRASKIRWILQGLIQKHCEARNRRFEVEQKRFEVMR